MSQETNLDYGTVCTIVGKLYIESQLQIQRASQEAGSALIQFQQQFRKQENETEKLRDELKNAQQFIEHLRKQQDDPSRKRTDS